MRVFTEDREMAAWFLLDLSPSVDFGSGDQRKSEVLRDVVTVLARLITRHGNRVGALLYGSRGQPGVDEVLPARGGRVHLLRLMHLVQRPPAPVRAAVGADGPTRLADLLSAAVHTVRQRSTVFVVSDFISEPGWEQPLGELARRHDVVAVRLLDPLELALPDLGLVPIRDAETGEQLLVDTHDKAFRQRFARIAAQREAQLRESLARAGVDTLELATDDDLADAVLRFVELRRRRSSLRAGLGGHLGARAMGLRPAAAVGSTEGA
ncbi:MAG: ATPase [Burkholderiales bacterium RIFCSPLOWO2_12_FULL_67_210]|nr:MAG: ATPase [Burkholderiales bacterium RIFCSPLOWO2_12_FULL_67_210]